MYLKSLIFFLEKSAHFKEGEQYNVVLFVDILNAIKLYYDSKRFTRNNDATKEKVKTAMQQKM